MALYVPVGLRPAGERLAHHLLPAPGRRSEVLDLSDERTVRNLVLRAPAAGDAARSEEQCPHPTNERERAESAQLLPQGLPPSREQNGASALWTCLRRSADAGCSRLPRSLKRLAAQEVSNERPSVQRRFPFRRSETP